jgi:hypothetical protein
VRPGSIAIAGRMRRGIEMQNSPPIMLDDKEAIEYAERYGWNREEVECGDHFSRLHQSRTRGRPHTGLPLSLQLLLVVAACRVRKSASLLTASIVFGVARGEPIFRYGNRFSGVVQSATSTQCPDGYRS